MRLDISWESLVPLKEKDDQVEPDQEGIELPGEQDLLYLAYEGYSAKVPAPWKPYQCELGIVYGNTTTGQIIDEHPCDEIYRDKVERARLQLQQEKPQELPSIIEQKEEDLKNDSDIYPRKRQLNSMAALRQPLTLDGRKQISSLHQIGSVYSGLNSALDRNITNLSQDALSLEGTGKILPSSLLKQEAPMKPQTSLEQYGTVVTRKESSHDEKEEIRGREEVLRKRLKEMKEQEKLKRALLEEITQSNDELMEKIKRKLHRRKKKSK